MLIKYVKTNGTGDYTDITNAFDDMLISGVAASGNITEYMMIVDGETYSGTFSGEIPYNGKFNVIGSGTYLHLITEINNIQGTYSDPFTPNLNIEDMVIDCSGLSNYSFLVPSGFGLSIKNTEFINNISGIYNAIGTVVLDNVSSCGISGSSFKFLYDISGGLNIVRNSNISYYDTAFYSKNLTLSDSFIHSNSTGVCYVSGYDIFINKSLFYDNEQDINIQSGNLYLDNSTLNDHILVQNTYVYANGNIITTPNNISGICQTGSYLINSCLYDNIINPTLSYSGNIYGDPLFNNSSIGDYRLKFKQTEGSPAVEVKPNLNYDSSIEFITDASKLQLYDSRGKLINKEFLPYIYTQGSTITLSDYNREIKFAEILNLFKTITYKLIVNLKFEETNVLTTSSFNLNQNEPDLYPWDWDIKEIDTTQITNENKYIIPRSVINIEDIIASKIGLVPTQVFYSDIVKENIKVYIISDLRGIAYDYSLSSPGQTILWTLDGNNQSLIKKDAYIEDYIENYPLLCYSPTKTLVRPSGLIYTGVRGDYYTFIKYNDPDTELLGLTELGDFNWIATDINQKYDLRGVLIYKDNLFITGSKYSTDVTNRTITSSGESIGYLFWYNNNDLFTNYIKPTNNINLAVLSSGNYYPTDLTMYEDGTLMIADYLSNSGIYKYKLAYDYCLVNSSYDNETNILLREYYTDVDL